MTRNIRANTRKDDWQTPSHLFKEWHGEFGFTIDLAAADYNAQLPRYITAEQDALSPSMAHIWQAPERGWCNPNYDDIAPWQKQSLRACADGFFSVWLLPANTETAWFNDYCAHAQVDFFRGRIPFVDATPPAIEAERIFRAIQVLGAKKKLVMQLAVKVYQAKKAGSAMPAIDFSLLSSLSWSDVVQAAEKRLPGPSFPSMLVIYDPYAPAGRKAFRTRDAKTGKLL